MKFVTEIMDKIDEIAIDIKNQRQWSSRRTLKDFLLSLLTKNNELKKA